MDVGLVCDACSALTPIGVPHCARCGSDVALDPRARGGSRPPASTTQTAAATIPCPKCGFVVASGLKFCPSCGQRMPLPGARDNFDGETRVGPVASQGSKPGRATMMFSNVMQTARELFIHRNTLLYRLDRIRELGGFDLDDAETRLKLQLALRAHELTRISDG